MLEASDARWPLRSSRRTSVASGGHGPLQSQQILGPVLVGAITEANVHSYHATPGDVQPTLRQVNGRHTGRCGATPGDWGKLIWEQKAGASNLAIPTSRVLAAAATALQARFGLQVLGQQIDPDVADCSAYQAEKLLQSALGR
jgi:hypothetical protein